MELLDFAQAIGATIRISGTIRPGDQFTVLVADLCRNGHTVEQRDGSTISSIAGTSRNFDIHEAMASLSARLSGRLVQFGDSTTQFSVPPLTHTRAIEPTKVGI